MKKITVSAAVILRKNQQTNQNEVFAAARGYGEYKGWWEFPGGKLETGETPEQCIVREIFEELAATVQTEKTLGVVEYDYPDFHLTMHCILCTITGGELKLLEAQDARWLNLETLHDLQWLPADKLILKEVEKLLS